jgi:hypothetical protein
MGICTLTPLQNLRNGIERDQRHPDHWNLEISVIPALLGRELLSFSLTSIAVGSLQ